jgi:outer membrane protein assembly factor BamE (lipoprotein component of BamABCDE complex)
MGRRAAALLLLVALAGCRSAPSQEMWDSVEIGMTGAQVKAILGEPAETSYVKGRDIWFYENPDGQFRGISFGPEGTVVGR